MLSAGFDQGSYNQGREQIPLDPYNQESGDTYGRSRGYEDSYGREGEGSRGSYGSGYRETYGSRDDYGRVADPYDQRGYLQRGGGGYGAAGDSDTYPSSYTVVPVPGQIPPRNCTGSACCVPKCFAEKGSRVSDSNIYIYTCIHPSVLDRSSIFIYLFVYHRDHQVYWDHRGRKGRGDFRARKVCWGQKGTKVNLVLRDRVERKVTGYVEYKFSKLLSKLLFLQISIFLCTNFLSFFLG